MPAAALKARGGAWAPTAARTAKAPPCVARASAAGRPRLPCRPLGPRGSGFLGNRWIVRAASSVAPDDSTDMEDLPEPPPKDPGPSTDLSVIFRRFKMLALPYWNDEDSKDEARKALALVVVLTLATTGVSVVFNFLGRDFFNAISEKEEARFWIQLYKYLGAFVVGIPVFVLRDYYQSKLAVDWRAWMTNDYLGKYLDDQTFYNIQANDVVDNPDQRIASDIREFTGAALGIAITLLNSLVDLISFSGIMFSIYPPLFGVLVGYAVGGTALSVYLGRSLVGLNFNQEAREADLRFSLVRLRENSESIAFYKGEGSEGASLKRSLDDVVSNYVQLITTSRNLDFFTSFYRFLIQLLPAAVVAPLFFRGEIGFGTINQSQSAFNHILSDVSLVVYQFDSLAGFGATVDRLGEFAEVVEARGEYKRTAKDGELAMAPSNIVRRTSADSPTESVDEPVLALKHVTIATPDFRRVLVDRLDLELGAGESLLIMGPSGAGKTSVLRAVAGLWRSGKGSIQLAGEQVGAAEGEGSVMFVPQKTYTVQGTLRENLCYPKWRGSTADDAAGNGNGAGDSTTTSSNAEPMPSDEEMVAVLKTVRLGSLLDRCSGSGPESAALDAVADWSASLSVGEAQRLGFARALLARPALLLMDESTSGLDVATEAAMYRALAAAGIAYVSVGHRPTLAEFHGRLLKLDADDPTAWAEAPIESVVTSNV